MQTRERRVGDDRLKLDDSAGRFTTDRGYILPIVALLIIPLLVFTAFAVDVGAWYAQGNKMQRAADNAAMAGVVWLPNKAEAKNKAKAVLLSNGYNPDVSPNDDAGWKWSYPTDTQMSVALTRTATRYFSGVVSKSAQNLTRSAVAEFNTSIPLGSPSNQMGNNSTTDGDPLNPGFWNTIVGAYTGHDQGDPFSGKCADNTGAGNKKGVVPASSCPRPAVTNGDYKPEGYIYAIDVPAAAVGHSIRVDLYDAIGLQTGNTTTGDYTSTSATGANNDGFPTYFALYDSDGSDLTVSVDPSLRFGTSACGGTGTGSQVINTSAASQTKWQNIWTTFCTFTPTKSGIHPLQVKTSNMPGVSTDPEGAGHNKWAARAVNLTSAGTKVQMYAVDNLPITSPSGATVADTSVSPNIWVTRLYLADISQEYAGRKLTFDMWDAGDGGGNEEFYMQFLKPPGGAPATVPNATSTIACTYSSPSTGLTFGPATTLSSSTCNIRTKLTSQSGTGEYDGKWLRVAIDIPTTYTCTTDCWWTLKYKFGTNRSNASDTLTFSVTLYGDPVHLVQ